jgi:hypothetical protein
MSHVDGLQGEASPSSQGSQNWRWPRSLSREVSVRSATLWFDLLLFCYNFLLIIMTNGHYSKNPAPESAAPSGNKPP